MFYGDERFLLKGINWNGFESDCNVIHGMWANTLEYYLDLLRDHQFNAIRLPLPFEIMNDLDTVIKSSCTTADSTLYDGMTVRDFIPVLLDKLQSRGMFCVFDLHTIGGVITEFPWTDTVSEDQVLKAWLNFAQFIQEHPALMGFEIKNEPHGRCSTDDFHTHSAKVIQTIHSPLFKGLFFIDGTSHSPVDGDVAPWGGTFEGISQNCDDDALCSLKIPERIVFSPHIYGPDVRGLENTENEGDETFERRFGFLKNHAFFNASAIVVTEFGGHLQNLDQSYFQKWASFMKKQGLDDSGYFFWTFPPSSADTGGFLNDDYVTINQEKVEFLQKLQQNPSKFYIC